MPKGEDVLRERPVRESVAQKWEKIKDAVPVFTEKTLAEQEKKKRE